MRTRQRDLLAIPAEVVSYLQSTVTYDQRIDRGRSPPQAVIFSGVSAYPAGRSKTAHNRPAGIRTEVCRMALTLPPLKEINYDESTIQYVYDQLTSVIIGRPMAVQPYTFYEEIDAWLGPWGQNGYPLAYGKFYAVAFKSDQSLSADPETKQWVWDTTRTLQEALRDYIVGRMRSKTLGAITEPELRSAAFASYTKAYSDGGLAKVALTSPLMVPFILSIPGKEFNPAGPKFAPTIRQVLKTAVSLSPQILGSVLAAAAGPAHSGLFAIASRRDELGHRKNERYRRALPEIKHAIDSGDLDDVRLLKGLIEGLNCTEYPNQQLANQARTTLLSATARLNFLKTHYSSILKDSPAMQKQFKSRFGTLLRDATGSGSPTRKGQ